MRHEMISQKMMQCLRWLIPCLLILLLPVAAPTQLKAATLGSQYPELSSGLLKSAELVILDDDTLLIFDGVTITLSQLLTGINNQDPKLRNQLEKNLIFLLEQEATRHVLLNEARKAGITPNGGNDNQTIQSLFEYQTQALSVSEDEARIFYAAHKEMVGGAPFEQVANNIKQYLLQEKKQQAVADYMAGLSNLAQLRINKGWVEAQSRLAVENPVEQARLSGTPTMVEFGATGCKPCDMMQPILDKLHKDFPQKLNVVFIHVGEEQILAARYGIRSIPVQVFYDATGKEVSRHVGFYAEKDVLKELKKAGL